MDVQPNTQDHAMLSVLWSREAIAARVKELAIQISRDYAGKDLLLVGVLKGAFVFLADLMRALEIPVQVEFVRLASYGKGATSAGQVRVLLDLEASIAGRHVLIVEDILDTGLTLGFLFDAGSSAGLAQALRPPPQMRQTGLRDHPRLHGV